MHGTDRIDPDRLGRYSSGDTEIRHLHLAVTRYNHILRFDVPVHNMLVMPLPVPALPGWQFQSFL